MTENNLRGLLIDWVESGCLNSTLHDCLHLLVVRQMTGQNLEHQEQKDLFQQFLIKLVNMFKRNHHFFGSLPHRQEAAIKSYLRRVIDSVVRDYQRKNLRRQNRLPTDSLDDMLEAETRRGICFQHRIIHVNQLYDKGELNSDIDGLYQALGNLPNTHRQICTLYYLEKLTLRDISDRMGLRMTTVFNRLKQGLKMLQGQYFDIA